MKLKTLALVFTLGLALVLTACSSESDAGGHHHSEKPSQQDHSH